MSKIFLIGFMGVGKSTLGKRLASAQNRAIIDTDMNIEVNENESVAGIFEKYGETYFRILEHRELINLRNVENAIIATGGGMPCFNDNMTEMLKQGTVVYLSRPENEIFQRLKNAKNQRPILKGKNEEEMKTIIHDLLQLRLPFYTRANIILDRDHQTHEHLIHILSYLS
jgi:shikimate kinase